MRENMLGAYGPWFAEEVLGDEPPALSLRRRAHNDLEQWRAEAKAQALECLAPVDLGGAPEVTVEEERTWDGLHIERLSWQLPMGPRTEAVFMRPEGSDGPLTGVLGLHDHGGNKFLGWRKICRIDDEPWEIQSAHHEHYYGDVGWATELARHGYGVLVHDTFAFGSRRVLPADVPERIRHGALDPEPDDLAGIETYNSFASQHEHIVAKSLLSVGTTWPGVYLVEDQRALDVLAARSEVDENRMGCGGLSGGGLRTVYLGGLDERIKCAVCVGFMTTWREFALDRSINHTWMTYAPLLAQYLDFPEILALRVPAATMVQSTEEDHLYTLPEMRRATEMIAEVFEIAGAPEMFRGEFYPGPHKLDLPMQADAFGWFDQHLGA